MEDSTIGEGNKQKIKVQFYKCSRCHTIITYEGKPNQKIIVECPNCGKKAMIDSDLRKPKKKAPSKKNKSNNKNPVEKNKFQFTEEIKQSNFILILLGFFITVTIISLLFIAALDNIYFEILYISIFIGIMVVREIMDEFIPKHHKKKINVIVSGFIITFLLLVINEVISFITT